jgi:hypothetical protein
VASEPVGLGGFIPINRDDEPSLFEPSGSSTLKPIHGRKKINAKHERNKTTK